MSAQSLHGIKVLDLTHHVSGPYCTKLLADFGAEVVKVERPGSGDPSRGMGPFVDDDPHLDKSLLFIYLNNNKRSITLDLKTDTGKTILKKLVGETDILVENFSPRVMQSLDLDYDTLREINPTLVMVSISNFGQTGPYRDYKATDIVEYAMGGLMYLFGQNHREPLKHALRQAQFKAGTNAASGAMIALFHRQMAGEGQHVDVSIQESMVVALRDTTSMYTYSGAIRRRQPPASGEIPRGPMKARDGYAVPIFMGRADWENIVEFLDDKALNEERFSTPELRIANAEELQQALEARFQEKNRVDWFESAHAHRYPFGVVNDPKEVVENPQFVDRGYFATVDHPVAGAIRMPGAPFKMSATPWKVDSPAPTLGQDNWEVLGSRLGHSRADLLRLQAEGVI